MGLKPPFEGLIVESAGVSFYDAPALRQFAPARGCEPPCLSAGGENERPPFNSGDRITRKHVRLESLENDVSHVVRVRILTANICNHLFPTRPDRNIRHIDKE